MIVVAPVLTPVCTFICTAEKADRSVVAPRSYENKRPVVNPAAGVIVIDDPRPLCRVVFVASAIFAAAVHPVRVAVSAIDLICPDGISICIGR